MSRTKGFFLTLEGGEGAGKSTLAKRLQTEIEKRGIPVVITREPGGSFLGEAIRHLLLQPGEKEIFPFAELLLFLAARAQHIEELIDPALKQGKVVISDRFSDSTIVYQGVARGAVAKDQVERLCRAVEGTCTPDCTFLLDLPPEVGFQRARHRSLDRIEQEGATFHRAIRQGFLELARKEKQRIVVLDAEKSPTAVFKQAWSCLAPRIHEIVQSTV